MCVKALLRTSPLLLALPLFLTCAGAETGRRAPLISKAVDEGQRITLGGHTRPETLTAQDLGRVAEDMVMEHLTLQLKRSPEQDAAAQAFVNSQNDRRSPNFHKWVTMAQFGQMFGAAPEDIAVVSRWLESHGLRVNQVVPNNLSIDFSGTAAQVSEAFHTEIHNLISKGENHYANIRDPQIPAALGPAVSGPTSLNNFMPHAMVQRRVNYTLGGSEYPVVPGDLATIYNFNPVFAAGLTGTGQTIMVVEDSDVYSVSDWAYFRKTFGLSLAYPKGSLAQIHPAPGSGGPACTDPGANGDDAEASLDVEWATAAAPNAAIVLASCSDTTQFGGFIALQNLLADGGKLPTVVSISYGEAEGNLGASDNSYISSLYQTAAAAGISVFVSSGDEGAASANPDAEFATHGITVSGFTSTNNNVSVGGTDFSDYYSGTGSTYWSATNGPTYASALSYIPEIPWNDSCAGVLVTLFVMGPGSVPYGPSGFCNSGTTLLNDIAGSGGPSSVYAKPTWQVDLFGNPADAVRDIPDVSLFASNGFWGHYYVACLSDPSYAAPCVGEPPSAWVGFGGTSISSPIMAGIQALINQKTGSLWGNPSSIYYGMANSEYGATGSSACNSSLGNGVSSACIYYDVTLGDMDVDCKLLANCYHDGATIGVLSTSDVKYQPAYPATPGWDFATGIGTVNAYNFVFGFDAP